jgi:Fe2+ transport system protein FeoA
MRDSERELTALANLPSGCDAEVVDFHGCRRRAQRLAELGMTPGTQLAIVRTSPGQPLLLRVRGALLAIDRRSARDVIVRPIEQQPAAARRGFFHGRRSWRFRFGRGRRHSKPGRKR